MALPGEHRIRILGPSLPAVTLLALAMVIAMQSTQAQTLRVLHSFKGTEGANPTGGLSIGDARSLYGVTAFGGSQGYGTVFRLSRRDQGWVPNTLHTFTGGSDGSEPLAPLILDTDGNLYGTTSSLGAPGGTVFKLSKPGGYRGDNLACHETLLYSFTGGSDGQNPGWGPLVFDQAGNLYGTTTNSVVSCGGPNCGNVYKLTCSNGSCAETTLYNFTGGSDGGQPFSGVIFDKAGNLYGTASQGGLYGAGVVYQLTPTDSGWTESILYNFSGGSDGGSPTGQVFDKAGNLYGATALGGSGGGGTVFMLSPSGSNWTYTLLHSFTGSEGPMTSLSIDASGSLYGTTYLDGAYGLGSVFKLMPSNGGWIFTSLHDFTGVEGYLASSTVVFDARGNLYGETWAGGAHRDGTLWKITP